MRELCHLTPAERFAALRGRTDAADALIDALDQQYADFLAMTQQSSEDLLDRFSNSAPRREALQQANGYGTSIYRLLSEITPEDRLRYLVI